MLTHIIICIVFVAIVAYILIHNSSLQKITKKRYLTAHKQLRDVLTLSEAAGNTTVALEAYGMLQQAQSKLETLIEMTGGEDNASEMCNIDDVSVIVAEINLQIGDVKTMT